MAFPIAAAALWRDSKVIVRLSGSIAGNGQGVGEGEISRLVRKRLGKDLHCLSWLAALRILIGNVHLVLEQLHVLRQSPRPRIFHGVTPLADPNGQLQFGIFQTAKTSVSQTQQVMTDLGVRVYLERLFQQFGCLGMPALAQVNVSHAGVSVPLPWRQSIRRRNAGSA